MTPTPWLAHMLATIDKIQTIYMTEKNGSARRRVLDGLLAARSLTTVIRDVPAVYTLRQIDLLSTLPQLSLLRRAQLRALRPKVLREVMGHLSVPSRPDIRTGATKSSVKFSLPKMAPMITNQSADTRSLMVTLKSTQSMPCTSQLRSKPGEPPK